MSKLFNSPLFLALVSGMYIAVFFVTNNLTMLSGVSFVVLLIAFIIPLVFAVFIAKVSLRVLKVNLPYRALAVFIVLVFVLIVLRHSILEQHNVKEFLNMLGEVNSHLPRAIYALFAVGLAISISFLCRTDIRVLTSMISAMLLVAIAVNIPAIGTRVLDGVQLFSDSPSITTKNLHLSSTPNIYFILADGYGSLAYMKDQKIDLNQFINNLEEEKFVFYEDTFSNYHPTTAALTAMLNMEHHFYAKNQKFGEIAKSGRLEISGANTLVDIMKNNGYTINIVHQGSYLLYFGCTINVDSCFPADRFPGAQAILSLVVPSFLWSNSRKLRSQKEFQDEVERLVSIKSQNEPSFSYMHLFQPSHAGNEIQGICDQSEQIDLYSKRLTETNINLQKLIEAILNRDPAAVIVVAGDHGPFISNHCARDVDINSIEDYRDRLGVMLAIRWPDNYDGRYDKQIKTTINVFPYVLASLMENDQEARNLRAPDDAFAHGSDGYLKIMTEGELLQPPVNYSIQDMQDEYRNLLSGKYKARNRDQ